MANSKCQQTILVIEDGVANDGMLSLILATRGYKVVAAKNGHDAISKSFSSASKIGLIGKPK